MAVSPGTMALVAHGMQFVAIAQNRVVEGLGQRRQPIGAIVPVAPALAMI